MKARPSIIELFEEVEYPIGLYNEQGNKIYHEESDGYWEKWKYDAQGNKIYHEESDGYWEKYEYDIQGNETYYEDSEGYWRKYEYDTQGKQTYFEDNHGNKRGTSKNAHKELTVKQIEEKLGHKVKIIDKQ